MKHTNSFDALRIIAASLVIISHAFQISGSIQLEPLLKVTQQQMSTGSLGVAIFFILSGYLVMGSWDRRPAVLPFLQARMLRIFPGLALVGLVTVFVLGPLLTTDLHYWSDPTTYLYLKNILLLGPGREDLPLPGMFEHNVLPGIVNGSLWTLKYEFFCYLILVALGGLKLLDKKTILVLFLGLWVIYFRLDEVKLQPWLELPRYFLAGTAAYLWRDKIPWKRHWFWVSLAVLAMATIGLSLKDLMPIAGTYCVLYLGRGTRLTGWGRWGDPSYGIYIWGFPLQQATYQISHQWYINLMLTYPAVLVIGYTSWHLLEKQALKLKSRTLAETLPGMTAAPPPNR